MSIGEKISMTISIVMIVWTAFGLGRTYEQFQQLKAKEGEHG